MMINTDLRILKQQLFNPELSSFNNLLLDDEWNIYNNANLSIHITDKCNADCNFCIAHLRYLNDGLSYFKPELKNDDEYFLRLESILTILKNINPSVSLTGGEPTINRKFPTIIKILSNHNVRKRTITTNGSYLLNIVENKSILEHLSDYKLEHLNISRAHYNDDINSEIMVMNKQYIPNDKLKNIIQEAKLKGIKVRLSCALLKNGISSINDIMNYIDWAENIGVDAVIFRQLMQFDENTIKKGRISEYCKNEEVDLLPIWEEFDKNKMFDLYHQVLGYYYYVEVRKYNNTNVVSETADLRIINSQLRKFEDLFKKKTAFEMVFHPNGNLCAGWNEHQNIMSIMK